jgi:hypothetical protein
VLGIVAAVLAQLPDQSARGDIVPFIVMFLIGFVIAVIGHITQSREFVLAGIAIAGLAATLPWLTTG